MYTQHQAFAWTTCVLLMTQLGTVSALAATAGPDVSPDRLPAPATALAQELGIIPAPKEIRITNRRFDLSQFTGHGQFPGAVIVLADKPSRQAEVGAAEINDAIKAAAGDEIPVRTASSLSDWEKESASLIVVGQPGENALLERECGKRGIKLTAADPGPQGYRITFVRDGERQLALLAGCDPVGMLYACVTLRQLVRKDGNDTYAVGADIRDWPDARWRFTWTVPNQALQVANRADGHEEGLRIVKEQIDWLLRHKINVFFSYHAGKAMHARGPETLQPWYREVFRYAFDRGLWGYTFPVHDTLGWAPEDKPRPDLNVCFSYGRGSIRYWCWSRDEEMDRRYDEAAREIAANMPPDPGPGGMFLCLHMPDTGNMGWHKRCDQCRKRWGNDQGAAQAHVFNRFYEAMRRHVPNSKIILVPRPYAAWNLDAPKNQIYRERIEKIARSIPQDAYVVHVMGPREAVRSWKRAVGDRRLMHWGVGTWDSRSYYFGGDDLFAFTDGFRIGQDALKILGVAEYTWNINAPGSIEMHMDPKEPYYTVPAIDEGDTPADWGKSSAQWSGHGSHNGMSVWDRAILPLDQRLGPDVLRFEQFAARHLCGEQAAPHMIRVLGSELGQFVGQTYWWDLSFKPENLGMSGGPMFTVTSAQWRATVGDLEAAASALEKLVVEKIPVGSTPPFPMNLPAVLSSYRTASKARIWVPLVQAHEAIQASRWAKAGEALDTAGKTLAGEKEALRQVHARLLPHRSRPDELTDVHLQNALDSLEKDVTPHLDTMKAELQLRAGGELRDPFPATAARPRYRGGKMRVAVYRPLEGEGQVFGARGIHDFLAGDPGVQVSFVDNLRLDTLTAYDCLIFPACRSMPAADLAVLPAVRRFVGEHGGGVYIQHASVGAPGFPLRGSLFPEVAEYADRVESNQLTVLAAHPLAAPHRVGEALEHMYWDQMTLRVPGGESTVILADAKTKAPVVVAGQVGRGRVVLDGSIALATPKTETGRELALKLGKPTDADNFEYPAYGVSADLLRNAVRWFCGIPAGS